MIGLKGWLQDFPGQNGGVVTALLLILITGLVVIVRLALGLVFPDGYDTWIWALIALAGVNVVGMVGKRFTDINYKQAGTSPVNVEGPSTVSVTAQPAAPAAAPVSDGVGAPSAPAQPTARDATPALRAAVATVDPSRPVGAQVDGEGD